MRVKRLYAVNHDGDLYGPGDELDVAGEIGSAWVKSGSASLVEETATGKSRKTDEKKSK